MTGLFVFILIFLLLASAAYAAYRGAPWVPTWKKDLLRIEKLANLKKEEKFIELGCGTGRVCRYLAKTTEAETFGIELSILQWMIARFLSSTSRLMSSRAKRALASEVEGSLRSPAPFSKRRGVGRDDSKFVLGDIFHHNLSQYDVIYMFLMPETYKKLRDKLKSELKPGARVITYVWPIPDWTPAKIDHVEGSPDLYLYVPISIRS